MKPAAGKRWGRGRRRRRAGSRHRGGRALIAGAVLAVVFLAFLVVINLLRSGRIKKASDWSQKRVAEASREVDGGPQRPSGRPRLVVDITSSMRGFVHQGGQFGEVLQALSNALGDREVFHFGAPPKTTPPTLDDLLTRHDSLDAFFRQRDSYSGSHNRDAQLLSQLDPVSGRPLILVTDGVYSSPESQGVEAVAEALDALIERGWSLGLFVFEAPYVCLDRNDACFYSESTFQKTGRPSASWLTLPCDRLVRPFYALLLDRTHDRIAELDRRLGETLGPGRYRGVFQIGPGLDTLLEAPPEVAVDQPADETGAGWLMFHRKLEEPLAVTAAYRVAPRAPVAAIRWRLALDRQTPADGDIWQSVGIVSNEAVHDPAVEEGSVDTAAGGSEVELWRDFEATLERLARTLDGRPDSETLATPELQASFDEVASWRRRAERSGLLCALLGQPEGFVERREADVVRTLYTIDLEKRRRFEDARLIRSGIVEPRFRALLHALRDPSVQLAATAADIPVGDSGGDERGGGASPDLMATTRFTLTPDLFEGPEGFAFFRLRFEPVAAPLRDDLAHRSTDDDGDPVEVLRTYRLASWLTMLVNRRLARVAEDPGLQFYITHPGQP